MISKDLNHLFGSLAQSTFTAFLIVIILSNFKTYLGGPSLNPDSEQCGKLTETFNNRAVSYKILSNFVCDDEESRRQSS